MLVPKITDSSLPGPKKIPPETSNKEKKIDTFGKKENNLSPATKNVNSSQPLPEAKKIPFDTASSSIHGKEDNSLPRAQILEIQEKSPLEARIGEFLVSQIPQRTHHGIHASKSTKNYDSSYPKPLPRNETLNKERVDGVQNLDVVATRHTVAGLRKRHKPDIRPEEEEEEEERDRQKKKVCQKNPSNELEVEENPQKDFYKKFYETFIKYETELKKKEEQVHALEGKMEQLSAMNHLYQKNLEGMERQEKLLDEFIALLKEKQR